MLGIISAIVAYLANGFKPGVFASKSYDILVASVLLLLLSMYFGFMRIERVIAAKQINALNLNASERRGALMDTLGKSPNPYGQFLNAASGEVFTRQQGEVQIAECSRIISEANAQFDKVAGRGTSYYKLRNRLFLVGFLGVFVAKIAAPYLG
jgi:hypothetical protein